MFSSALRFSLPWLRFSLPWLRFFSTLTEVSPYPDRFFPTLNEGFLYPDWDFSSPWQVFPYPGWGFSLPWMRFFSTLTEDFFYPDWGFSLPWLGFPYPDWGFPLPWLRFFPTLTEVFLTLIGVFPCFLLSCKSNARVKLAKTGHGSHCSILVVICVVLLFLCCSLYCFVCKCVLYYCHRVSTRLQLISLSNTKNIYKTLNQRISEKAQCQRGCRILPHSDLEVTDWQLQCHSLEPIGSSYNQ